MAGVRTPPGRSGRLWLAERLAVARHAVRLLEQKQVVLRKEEARLARLVEETGSDWRSAAAAAERWSRRALVIGDRQELGRCTTAPAQVDIAWRTRMGVTYPATTGTQVPPHPQVAGSAAFTPAVLACGDALEAAVEHAAAVAAHDRFATELSETTRRLRAIRNRWIPRMDEQLRQLDLRLDEDEREELARLRWAHDPVRELETGTARELETGTVPDLETGS